MKRYLSRSLLALGAMLMSADFPIFNSPVANPAGLEENSSQDRAYLGTECDRSSDYVIEVESINGRVEVRKGETKWVRVRSHRFRWFSHGRTEWTTAHRNTTLVRVKRDYGRRITWDCYSE